MKDVRIISFDGLHRSGKGTQISLLEDHLRSEDVPVVVMRGDGSRKGDGSPNDRYSAWWQGIQPFLHQVNSQGSFNQFYWNLAADRLNLELHDMYHITMPRRLEEEEKDQGVILLDRSIISRYFVARRDNIHVAFEDLLSFKDSKGCLKEVVLPHQSFILHVPQDELLERNEIRTDHPDKYYFRKKIISDHYDHFEAVTKNLKQDGLNLIHLNGNEAPYLLFEEIKAWYTHKEGVQCMALRS